MNDTYVKSNEHRLPRQELIRLPFTVIHTTTYTISELKDDIDNHNLLVQLTSYFCCEIDKR